MPIVFAGYSALCLYRSRVEFGEPVRGEDACADVVDQTNCKRGSLERALSCLSDMLGPAWHGPQAVEIMAAPWMRRNYPGVVFKRRAWTLPDRLFPIKGLAGLYAVSPEIALEQISHGASLDMTLRLALELCGSYRCNMVASDGANLQRMPCLTARNLHWFVEMRGRGCSSVLRQACEYVVDGSASPVESAILTLLCLPPRLGGYGMPLPELNATLNLSSEASLLLRKSSLRPDFLWRKEKTIIEYDSTEFHFKGLDIGALAIKDRNRADVLASMGFTVRSLTAGWLFRPEAFSYFVGTLDGLVPSSGGFHQVNERVLRERLYLNVLFGSDPMSGTYLLGNGRKISDLRFPA